MLITEILLCQRSRSSPKVFEQNDKQTPKRRRTNCKGDVRHGNSLFQIKVSAITFFAQGSELSLDGFLGRGAMTTNIRTFGRASISALTLVGFFAIGSTVASAQTRIGTANSVKPEASGSIAGTLSAGSGVHANETVKTGSSGQAGLRFNDQSNLTVGPSSSVRLDKFAYDPNKGSGAIAVEAARGAFRFSTGAQNTGEVKIKTPSGTLGIRG
jgi:hypothetical protein